MFTLGEDFSGERGATSASPWLFFRRTFRRVPNDRLEKPETCSSKGEKGIYADTGLLGWITFSLGGRDGAGARQGSSQNVEKASPKNQIPEKDEAEPEKERVQRYVGFWEKEKCFSAQCDAPLYITTLMSYMITFGSSLCTQSDENVLREAQDAHGHSKWVRGC